MRTVPNPASLCTPPETFNPANPRFHLICLHYGWGICDNLTGKDAGYRSHLEDQAIAEVAKLNAEHDAATLAKANRFTVHALTDSAFEVIDGQTGQRASFRYTRQMAQSECDRLNRQEAKNAPVVQPVATVATPAPMVGRFLSPKEMATKAIAEMADENLIDLVAVATDEISRRVIYQWDGESPDAATRDELESKIELEADNVPPVEIYAPIKRGAIVREELVGFAQPRESKRATEATEGFHAVFPFILHRRLVMPLSINVGLSRKASENYQSNGASINIVAELDSQLLGHPDELQKSIAHLYSLARAALDRQSAGPGATHAAATPPRFPPANGHNGRSDDRYSGNGNNGGNRGPAPMTDKQRGAIFAIAKRADVDAYASARQTFGIDLDQLSSRQASQLIDSIKA